MNTESSDPGACKLEPRGVGLYTDYNKTIFLFFVLSGAVVYDADRILKYQLCVVTIRWVSKEGRRGGELHALKLTRMRTTVWAPQVLGNAA